MSSHSYDNDFYHNLIITKVFNVYSYILKKHIELIIKPIEIINEIKISNKQYMNIAYDRIFIFKNYNYNIEIVFEYYDNTKYFYGFNYYFDINYNNNNYKYYKYFYYFTINKEIKISDIFLRDYVFIIKNNKLVKNINNFKYLNMKNNDIYIKKYNYKMYKNINIYSLKKLKKLNLMYFKFKIILII